METFRIEQKEDTIIIAFAGEITLEITSELKRQIDDALGDSVFENLIVDLAEITFMDSSGIGFLVALNTKIMGLGKKMFLFKPSNQVSKTLELVQLNNFFNILENDDDLLTILPE